MACRPMAAGNAPGRGAANPGDRAHDEQFALNRRIRLVVWSWTADRLCFRSSQASHHRSAVSSDIPESVRLFRVAMRQAAKMRTGSARRPMR
jgi:hypothetical protein